ncbi:MAG: ATP-binding protein [Bacteroidota bacterium]
MRLISGLYSNLNTFLDGLFTYKGISKSTLQYKKTYWLIIAVVTFYVACMCIPAKLLGANSLLIYGIILLAMWIPFLVLFPVLPYPLKWIVHFSQHMAILITFFIIIRLGGIPHCGGIIFGSLNSVIFSVLFYSIAWSVWYFFLFVVCTIANYVIQNILQLPPEMIPELNQLFFLINTLFLGGLTLVVVLIYLFQHTRYEKERAQRYLELDEVKTRLFTNITHEFRTPLTVIQGMVDQIQTGSEIDINQKLSNILKSSQDLLDLVNQMLELARLDSGAVARTLVKRDVITYLKVIFESLQAEAQTKKLDFLFHSDAQEYVMEFDQENLRHIVWNLLSNAIKYTPESGSVDLDIRVLKNDPPRLIIHVKDSGEGIKENELDQIFSRFFRGSDERIRKVQGTGLGLSITKELVELLEGEIAVHNSVGAGTCFTVTLPVSYKKEETPIETMFHTEEPSPHSLTGIGAAILPEGRDEYNTKTAERNGKPSLLIVEDNREVAEYLHDILEEKYHVIRAMHGRSGLHIAMDRIPDLIISDIMMPMMDGISMLEQLRGDIRTSHIPVILLTAKANVASRLEGLNAGAILYLAKPFQKQELLLSIRNVLSLSDRFRERFSGFPLLEIEEGSVDSMEYKFLNNIQDAFGVNLEDPDFGVTQLCKLTAMSRAQLYRKLKALTGNGIMEYLNRYRLHMAKELLRSTDLSIIQVAFKVGFKDHSHFSRKFRKEHGMSPSGYRASTI